MAFVVERVGVAGLTASVLTSEEGRRGGQVEGSAWRGGGRGEGGDQGEEDAR